MIHFSPVARHTTRVLSGRSMSLATAVGSAKEAMAGGAGNEAQHGASLVMQLVVDATLLKQPGWTIGPMMAQAAHASSAILEQTSQQPNTRAYLSSENLTNMRKVVLKTSSGTTLRQLSDALNEKRSDVASSDDAGRGEAFPDHYLWIEQPENIPTVLAIAPNTRPSTLKKVLNKCSLLRD